MWRKSERYKAKLADLIDETVSSVPSGPCAHCLFLADPSLDHTGSSLSFEEFRKVLNAENADVQGSLPLDNVYPTQDGFIGRHYMGNNNPRSTLISIRWWHNGNARLTIPLAQVQYSRYWPRRSDNRLEYLLTMIEKNAGYSADDVLDLGTWSYIMTLLAKRYLAVRDKCGLTGPLWAKIVVANVAGAIPFVPMNALADQLQAGGIPTLTDGLVTVPFGTDPETFLFLNDNKEHDLALRSLEVTIQLILRTYQAMGIHLYRADGTVNQTILDDYYNSVGAVQVALAPTTRTK
jgi:hypothetical protein